MRRAAGLVALAGLVVVLGGCGGGKQTVTTTTATPPPGTTSVVRIYLLHEGKVQPVKRAVRSARPEVAAAWRELTDGQTLREKSLGLMSAVASQPDWRLETRGDGALSLATMEQSRPALAQIVYTLTQFAPERSVVVNGRHYARNDFEDVTPAILVESPLPDQSVGRPVRLIGTANTFEATFQYELVDSAGKVIAKHFVTATSGSGTRGTFDVTIPYPTGHGGPGELVVYESSAKDGSRIHVVKIPIRLTG
jgi:hypothetical protein